MNLEKNAVGRKLDAYYDFQKSYKNTIFSYQTAFYLLGLMAEPDVVNITATKNIYKRKGHKLSLHLVKEEVFELGMMTITTPLGNKIKLYNLERSICDVARNKRWFATIEFEKILIQYFKSPTKNIPLLLAYAKIFHVYDDISFMIQVMNA